ncbi:putative membrane protein [Burkholderia mallei]|nr:putative membrane protein [Burkholderia mallei FMH]EDK58115.1 putative membrane protein [Burkholderia mallei JHU]KGC72295.1 putative membrane protein [Burkholderia mallei]KOS77364.1 putative membrane protein [Burkholderia mallei]KOS97722.1 putative membrane protein [Burkholderia mallei]
MKGRCFRVHVASARSRTVWVFAVAIRRERGGHPGDGYRMTGGSQRMASRVGSFEAGQACGRRRAGCRAPGWAAYARERWDRTPYPPVGRARRSKESGARVFRRRPVGRV